MHQDSRLLQARGGGIFNPVYQLVFEFYDFTIIVTILVRASTFLWQSYSNYMFTIKKSVNPKDPSGFRRTFLIFPQLNMKLFINRYFWFLSGYLISFTLICLSNCFFFCWVTYFYFIVNNQSSCFLQTSIIWFC